MDDIFDLGAEQEDDPEPGVPPEPEKPKKAAKAKAKSGKPKKKKVPAMRDIELSESLLRARATTKSLAAGVYQRKIGAFFAPYVLPALFNSMRRGLAENNVGTQRLAAETYGVVQPKSNNVNIALTQNNQSAHIRGQVIDDGKIRSFEDISRMLAEKRQQLAIAPPPPIYDATPEDEQ